MLSHVGSALLVNRVTAIPSAERFECAKWLSALWPHPWSSLPGIMHNEILVDVRAALDSIILPASSPAIGHM